MNNKKRLILFLSFVAVSIAIGTYLKTRQKTLLEGNTSTTHAVFYRTIVMVNTGPVSYFNYKIGTTEYHSDVKGRFSTLKKGDSVLIEYSVEDPNVFEVIDELHVADSDK